MMQYSRKNGKPKLSLIGEMEAIDADYAESCTKLLRAMFPDAHEYQILLMAHYMVLKRHGGDGDG